MGTSNAYRLLEWIATKQEVSSAVRDAARRLTVHINEDHRLPHAQDPLQDAELIVHVCLRELPASQSGESDD
jgi:hypothetical protein